jgi:hypothetical protein
MKGDLKVAGFGVNIMQGQYSLVGYRFDISFWIARRLEQNKNNVTTPACKKIWARKIPAYSVWPTNM